MKEKILAVLFLLFTTTILIAAEPSDFGAAVKQAAKDFSAAIGSGDAAGVGSMYAPDAIAFPPNGEMVKGREAIQGFWKGFIDAGMKAQLEVVETENEGNLGVEVGKYTILTADGKTADQGKYVVVWKKSDDGWKLYRDIWNSSMPAPAPPAK